MTDITELDLEPLREAFAPLVGLRITWLSIPGGALLGFEPSQIAVIVNTLLDGILPQIKSLASDEENAAKLAGIGCRRHPAPEVNARLILTTCMSRGGGSN